MSRGIFGVLQETNKETQRVWTKEDYAPLHLIYASYQRDCLQGGWSVLCSTDPQVRSNTN